MANVELRILTERFELPSHRKRHVVCKTSEFLAYRTFRFGTDRAGFPFCCNSWSSFERLKFLSFCRPLGESVVTARACAAACGLRVSSFCVNSLCDVREVEHTRVAQVVCFSLPSESEGSAGYFKSEGCTFPGVVRALCAL